MRCLVNNKHTPNSFFIALFITFLYNNKILNNFFCKFSYSIW